MSHLIKLRHYETTDWKIDALINYDGRVTMTLIMDDFYLNKKNHRI